MASSPTTESGRPVGSGVHDSLARFRANEALLAAAQKKARRDGMTFSELMRHALRRELENAG